MVLLNHQNKLLAFLLVGQITSLSGSMSHGSMLSQQNLQHLWKIPDIYVLKGSFKVNKNKQKKQVNIAIKTKQPTMLF